MIDWQGFQKSYFLLCVCMCVFPKFYVVITLRCVYLQYTAAGTFRKCEVQEIFIWILDTKWLQMNRIFACSKYAICIDTFQIVFRHGFKVQIHRMQSTYVVFYIWYLYIDCTQHSCNKVRSILYMYGSMTPFANTYRYINGFAK